MMSALFLLPQLMLDVPSGSLIAGVLLLLSSFVVSRHWQGLTKYKKAFLSFVFVLTGVAVAVWRVYDVHENYLAHTPKRAVKITAHVTLEQIADSAYDPISGSPYRQKASLTHLTTADTIPLPDTMTVLLTAYPNKKYNTLAPLATLKAGDQVVMTLKISPLALEQDTLGFDSTRWLMTRHIHANAEVLAVGEMLGHKTHFFERQRERFRHIFVSRYSADQNQAAAVLLSLLTGDRAFIDKPTKSLYQAAGISHLLAISGTHVLFLAILCAGAVCWLCDRYCPVLYKRLPRWQLRFVLMVVVALCYAWFTGFEVPALRTVLLLFLLGVARYLLLGVSSQRLLAAAAFLMMYADPYVLWQAGFWLSFVAVALLMAYESNAGATLWRLVALQGYIFIAMLPLTLLLFGKVSLWGLVVNMLAVGLFGWVIVPLNLLGGVLYALSPSLGGWFWAWAMTLLTGVHSVLEWLLGRFGLGYIGTSVSISFLLLGFLVLFAWRMPMIPNRFALLPVMALALSGLVPSADTHKITTLATSQNAVGAVLLQSQGQAYLLLSYMPTRRGVNEQVLFDDVWLQLKKAKVGAIQGVIVQNDDPFLLTLVQRLSTKMPIWRVYAPRAGGVVGKMNTLPCQADMTFEIQAMQATFVTGWQVGDTAMTTCNVLLTSATPLTVEHQTGVQSVGQILIDATQDDNLWRLYGLLCPAPISPDYVMTHSQSALGDEALAQLGAPKVLFSNHLKNAQERKMASERLLLLGS